MKFARRAWRRVVDFTGEHPFSSALLCLLAVAVPGYWKLENAIADNEAQAKALAEFVADEALVSCQDRNAGNAAARAATSRLISAVARFPSEDPDAAARRDEIVALLLDLGIAPAEETDVDCDGDGTLDAGDYP